MFKNPKLNFVLHSLGNLIAQGVILTEVQDPVARSIFQLVAAFIGVLVAFSDQSISKGQNADKK